MDRLEQLLERGARRHRDRLAAVCGKAELTYGELDLASNALAQRLLDAGVSADHRVGLYLAKGVGSVTALYGVLKTGAAYVPLDPTGPMARSLSIMEVCGMEVLLVGLPQLRKLAVSEQDLAGAGIRHVVVLNEKDVPADAVPPLPGWPSGARDSARGRPSGGPTARQRRATTRLSARPDPGRSLR